MTNTQPYPTLPAPRKPRPVTRPAKRRLEACTSDLVRRYIQWTKIALRDLSTLDYSQQRRQQWQSEAWWRREAKTASQPYVQRYCLGWADHHAANAARLTRKVRTG